MKKDFSKLVGLILSITFTVLILTFVIFCNMYSLKRINTSVLKQDYAEAYAVVEIDPENSQDYFDFSIDYTLNPMFVAKAMTAERKSQLCGEWVDMYASKKYKPSDSASVEKWAATSQGKEYIMTNATKDEIKAGMLKYNDYQAEMFDKRYEETWLPNAIKQNNMRLLGAFSLVIMPLACVIVMILRVLEKDENEKDNKKVLEALEAYNRKKKSRA